MIDSLAGVITHLAGPYMSVKTKSGVGYGVTFASDISIFKEGDEVDIIIYTHVRENEISLYGFENRKDLEIFQMLLSVSGIGPKAAQAIMATHRADGVINAILANNPEGLKVSGVGVRTAEKVVLELADKLKKKGYSVEGDGNVKKETDTNIDKDLYEAVEEAFMALGYTKYETKKMIYGIMRRNPEADSVEEFVKEGLRGG